jgi:hypothetical protein
MDKQFALDTPTGRYMVDCFSTDELQITVGRETIHFEFGEMFGPLPVTKRGVQRDLRDNHPFWRAVSLWNVQGARTENGTAIWHEPRKPVVELRGNRWFIIQDGEIGHDW